MKGRGVWLNHGTRECQIISTGREVYVENVYSVYNILSVVMLKGFDSNYMV